MLEKIRLMPALWGCKFFTFIFGLTGNRKNEKAGSVALHIDPDFLSNVAKSRSILTITGTNGKTTITHIISRMLENNKEAFSSNNWGPNRYQAYAWALADAVSIFNKPVVDKTVIELDELTSWDTLPKIRPQYLMITNIGRDSMYKNASPETITNSLIRAIDLVPDTALILNGDDPLSCFLGEGHRRIYFGVADMKNDVPDYSINDFGVCPVCGGIPEYSFRNYRHIGEFHCPVCGLKSPKKDYLCTRYDSKTMSVKDKEGEFCYPVVSDTIYNIYNQTAIIAYFREIGYSPETIAEMLKGINLPNTREENLKIGKYEVIRRALKGQNGHAANSVLETVVREKGAKEIILYLDETRDETGIEPICWIWDSDYQFFNDPQIKRIIVVGRRHLDHIVRLLVAGVDPDIIVSFDSEEAFNCDHLLLDVDRIYVIYDIDSVKTSQRITEKVIDYLKGKEK